MHDIGYDTVMFNTPQNQRVHGQLKAVANSEIKLKQSTETA